METAALLSKRSCRGGLISHKQHALAFLQLTFNLCMYSCAQPHFARWTDGHPGTDKYCRFTNHLLKDKC